MVQWALRSPFNHIISYRSKHTKLPKWLHSLSPCQKDFLLQQQKKPRILRKKNPIKQGLNPVVCVTRLL